VKRRPISPFSLSFLDIMFCGFGAVVLLVLILNHDTVRSRETVFADLRAEAVDLERQAIRARETLNDDRAALRAADEARIEADAEASGIEAEIAALELERSVGDRTAQERPREPRQRIEAPRRRGRAGRGPRQSRARGGR
jgi:hypothetical protein